MKKLNFIPAIIAAVFISTSAFATTPNYEVWDYENDPLEEVLEMEVIPEVTLAKPVVVNTLSLDAFPAQDNYLQINLPYSNSEVVGLVIYDKKGNVVFNKKEEYRMLKTVLLKDTGNNEYIIKAYNGNTIHQAKLKVTHI
jgi:hypothetical protein